MLPGVYNTHNPFSNISWYWLCSCGNSINGNGRSLVVNE